MDDLDWLIANIPFLRVQHLGQWVAIERGQVIASAADLTKLKEALGACSAVRPLITFISGAEPNWNLAYFGRGGGGDGHSHQHLI